MTRDEFDTFVEEVMTKVLEISNTKGREYAGDRDVLANFKRIAGEMMLPPEVVCWVYLRKHLDAIAYYCRTGKVLSENIEGRILDAIVYLCLLWARVKEQEKEADKCSLKQENSGRFSRTC